MFFARNSAILTCAANAINFDSQYSIANKQPRQNFPGLAFHHIRKRVCIQRRLRSDIHRPRTTLPRPVHKIRRRIHRARCSHHHHQRRPRNLPLNPIHLQRNLTEENNMRPQPRSACATSHLVQTLVNAVILNRRPSALIFTARLGQLPVHVNQPLRAGALVQVVHILRAEKETVAQLQPQAPPAQDAPDWARPSRPARVVQSRTATPAPDSVPVPQACTHPRYDARPTNHRMREMSADPLSALIPAPVKTKTRSPGPTAIFPNEPLQDFPVHCPLITVHCLYGSSKIFPVVFRFSISVCACPASASGNICSMRSFKSPFATQPSTSFARHSNSWRVAT